MHLQKFLLKNKKQTLVLLFLVSSVVLTHCTKTNDPNPENPDLIAQGKQIYRFDTFGDEDFWSNTLHIDKAIAGAANGGFGTGVSPNTALAVGLKVDAEALPQSVVDGIKSGAISLDDPASTLALLKLNAVVGLKGNFSTDGALQSVGITCASCHSTVDNSFAPGIGKRLDGWPNRDLNVGAIIALTDNAKPLADQLHVDEATLRFVLNNWGPGHYNAVLNMDGKALRPDGTVATNLIPAAFGLKDITLTTYTGWGDISYWNAYVGTTQMHGKGTLIDPRLNDPIKYPIAVENNFYNVTHNPDLLTSKLPALKAYQHSISAPKPDPGTYNAVAAARGKVIFTAKAKCASCHAQPLLADNKLHTPEEMGIDDFDAKRSPTGKYRTTPLGGLFTRAKGGYYHDGRFATLNAVVEHYNTLLQTSLTTNEKNDLVEYLKSL
ncbi:MAG: hypothetical protein ABI266_10655 [Ginsengibacter sp.]